MDKKIFGIALNANNIYKIHDYIMEESSFGKKKIVVVNVGTDKIIADAFGPLLGQMLKEKKYKHIITYGNLHHNVNCRNLEKISEKISEKHKDDLIIATDACFLRTSDINHKSYKKIYFTNKPLYPGQGVGKKTPPIGDMKITYNVLTVDEISNLLKGTIKIAEIYSKCKETVKLFDMLENTLKEMDKDEICNSLYR